MHPFARARERTRALNAVKMERMFAKPFVASLEGHVDAVETMARKPDTLDVVASGSWDGGAFFIHAIHQYPGLREYAFSIPSPPTLYANFLFYNFDLGPPLPAHVRTHALTEVSQASLYMMYLGGEKYSKSIRHTRAKYPESVLDMKTVC